MKLRTWIAAALLTVPGVALAAEPIEGNWKTASGATAVIAKCGGNFCHYPEDGQTRRQAHRQAGRRWRRLQRFDHRSRNGQDLWLRHGQRQFPAHEGLRARRALQVADLDAALTGKSGGAISGKSIILKPVRRAGFFIPAQFSAGSGTASLNQFKPLFFLNFKNARPRKSGSHLS